MLVAVCAVAVCLTMCRKNHELPAKQPLADEASEATQQALEQAPSVDVDLNNVVLPNGSNLIDFELAYDYNWLQANKSLLPASYQSELSVRRKQVQTNGSKVVGPQAIKNRIIARAQIEANFLVTGSNFTDLVKNKPDPQQPYGLAYVFGSKNYSVLSKSTGSCKEQLYGLDCSGMLATIMNFAGIPISGSAVAESDTTNWKKALAAAGSDYSNIRAQSFTSSQLALNQVQSGDIVYFYGNDNNGNSGIVHIGIALTDPNGNLMLYQSNGRSSSMCQKNYDGKHGPRRIAVNAPIAQSGWNFTDYGVVRLVASISGNWNAYIRCADASYDAITLGLKFPVVNNGTYQATGSGTDYTGEAINVTISGNYSVTTNTLTGTIVYQFPSAPTEQRSDQFSISLNYDDTGYSDLTKVIDNGGCSAQIRLVNQQSTTGGQTTTSIRTNAQSCHCSMGTPQRQ